MGGPCDCSPFKGSCLALHSPLPSSRPSTTEIHFARPFRGREPGNFMAAFPNREVGNLHDLPQRACSTAMPDPASPLPRVLDRRNPDARIAHGSEHGTSVVAAVVEHSRVWMLDRAAIHAIPDLESDCRCRREGPDDRSRCMAETEFRPRNEC